MSESEHDSSEDNDDEIAPHMLAIHYGQEDQSTVADIDETRYVYEEVINEEFDEGKRLMDEIGGYDDVRGYVDGDTEIDDKVTYADMKRTARMRTSEKKEKLDKAAKLIHRVYEFVLKRTDEATANIVKTDYSAKISKMNEELLDEVLRDYDIIENNGKFDTVRYRRFIEHLLER